MTKSTKNDLSGAEDKMKIPDDFHSFEVDPQPAGRNDAIEEALATAEAVVSKTHEEIIQELPPDGELSDSLSLKQVIENAEKRLEHLSDGSELQESGLPEMLDSLDIKAELGRPDEMTEPSYVSEMQEATAQVQKKENQERGGEKERDDPIRSDEDWNAVVDQYSLRDGQGSFDDEIEETTHIITPSRGVEKPGVGIGAERQARRVVFFEDRTEGDLAQDRVWQLLYTVYEEHFSGALTLNSGDMERRLFFENGQALIATSTARKDRMVELLHREGRLSDSDYIEACTAVGTTRRRAGAILVERGLISRRELFPLVQYHYETIIFDSFSWSEGTWKVYHGERPGAERITLGISTPALVLEGIRSHAMIEAIDEILPENAVPVITSDGPCQIGDTELSFDEKEIYRTADGLVSLDVLSGELEIPVMELRRFFAGLKILGLIRVEDMVAKSALEENSEDSYLDQETIENRSEAPMEENLTEDIAMGDEQDEADPGFERVRIENKIGQAEEGSYFDILEVSPNASDYEIEEAFGALVEQFDLERFATSEFLDLRPEVELIRAMIEEAYEVLRQPEMREQYRRVVVEDRSR